MFLGLSVSLSLSLSVCVCAVHAPHATPRYTHTSPAHPNARNTQHIQHIEAHRLLSNPGSAANWRAERVDPSGLAGLQIVATAAGRSHTVLLSATGSGQFPALLLRMYDVHAMRLRREGVCLRAC